MLNYFRSNIFLSGYRTQKKNYRTLYGALTIIDKLSDTTQMSGQKTVIGLSKNYRTKSNYRLDYQVKIILNIIF